MSKLSTGLTITALTATLAGSIGIAYAQSTSAGQGSAANPSTTTNTPANTNNGRVGATPSDPSMGVGPNTGSTNLERNTGAQANDGLNNLPATAAGTNQNAAPVSPVVTPERPPRADRN